MLFAQAQSRDRDGRHAKHGAHRDDTAVLCMAGTLGFVLL